MGVRDFRDGEGVIWQKNGDLNPENLTPTVFWMLSNFDIGRYWKDTINNGKFKIGERKSGCLFQLLN